MPEQETTIADLFRGTPEMISKFSRGAGNTIRRLGAWWAADKLPRSLVLAAAGWLTSIYRGWAIWAEIVAFVIASFTACGAAPAAEAAPEAAPEADDDHAGEELNDDWPDDDPVGEGPAPAGPAPGDVHALAARLTAGGSNVLLTRLAADLGAAHPGWDASTKAVKALLAEAGIPFREGVRAPNRKNGPGVHHTDVPPLPSPADTTPDAGVVGDVGAGQSANTNANNTEEWTTPEGFIWRAHPDYPNQTIVVGRADTA